MEKRAILFLVLSIIILFLYPYLLEKWTKKTPEPAGSQREVKSKEGNTTAQDRMKPQEDPIVVGDPHTMVEDQKEREVVVETDLIRVVLSNKGGVIKRWELKKYKDHLGESAKNIELLPTKGGLRIQPLDLALDGGQVDKALYQVIGDDLKIDERQGKGTLSFYLSNHPGGGSIRKELTFYRDSYRVDIKITLEGQTDRATLFLGENFGITDWGQYGYVGFIGPMSLINGRIEKDPIGKMEGDTQHTGLVRWAALQDKYFMSALLPEKETEGRIITRKLDDHGITVGLELQDQTAHLTLYAGPKEYDRLRAFRGNLEETIDFGWFIYGSWSLVRLVAKPLFSILNFFYQFSHNYGVAIIFLTVLIKVLFIPLTHKSYKSMKGMQAIQPQVLALQKKHKNDKEKLNREMLELYRTHKVNPVGGCLPMFLQIPFFIALFNILYTTIELRQAPFFLWIRDLSDKDPYYVLPIIMGATMVIQQKIQPTPMDPKQAKLMMFLPVIFTFLFLNFSSGLVLYWMTNNILTIAQQYATVRYLRKD